MYRTDQQFMKNPATSSSRIYIGGIAPPVVATDLEERFKVYGNILGLILRRSFAFIQYELDNEAQAAIRCENGAMFFGKKLSVRQALDKAQSASYVPPVPTTQPRAPTPKAPTPTPQASVPTPPAPTPSPKSEPLISQAPTAMQSTVTKATTAPAKQESPPEEMEISNSDDFAEEKSVEIEPEQQSRNSDVNSDTSDRRRLNRRGAMNRVNRDRFQDRFHYDDFNKKDIPLRDAPPRDTPDFYGREEFYRPGFMFLPIVDRPQRNDCEIIVVSRLLTEYAEYIEKRLKNIGLMVDLLYPNEDVPIGRVLANISSTGCLYAILVMPQNEEYRSLTLNILHGIPQEHRNMPIEDAMILITRNFDAYMRGDKLGNNSISGSTLLTDKHPEQIQMIFNLLAENRQLTTAQYDRIMKYLQERRELQNQFEITEGGAEGNSEPELNSKQAELQSRILNILNKSNEDAPKPVEAPSLQTGPTPLLNDPSVQKALDSLLSGDMFKTIASGM